MPVRPLLPGARRAARIAALGTAVASAQDRLDRARAELAGLESALGRTPSLLALEWARHRAVDPAVGHDDGRADAERAGLPLADGPADLEVLAFYGQVGALVRPVDVRRPPLVLLDDDGVPRPDPTGTFGPLPAGLDDLLAGVARLSVLRRATILRAEIRTDVGVPGLVRVVPPLQPADRYPRAADRRLGAAVERARVRLRHDDLGRTS